MKTIDFFKKTKILVGVFITTFFISVLASNVVSVPLEPTPNPPYNGAYWDFEIGTIKGWEMSEYNGSTLMVSRELNWNVSSMNTITYSLWKCYAIQLMAVEYDDNLGRFVELDPGGFPLQVSVINFTESIMNPLPSSVFPVTYFIPKNESGIMLGWCANSSYRYYKQFLNNTDNPAITTTWSPDNNLIQFSNNATEEYVKLVFYDDGTLKYGEMKSFILETISWPWILKYTRIDLGGIPTPPTPPGPSISSGLGFFIFIALGLFSLILYIKKYKS